MAHDGLTRRRLIASLAGGAAAAATGLPQRSVALADARHAPPARVFEQWIGSLAEGAIYVSVPVRVDLVGLRWTAPAGARIELRGRVRGVWGGWALASAAGHAPDGPPAGELLGEPIWLAGADRLALRTNAAVHGLTLCMVDVSAGRGARVAEHPTRGASAAALDLAQPVLQAGPGQPPIVDREAWALGRCPPAGPPAYGEVGMAFVHHTENPNGYSAGEVPAMLRAIFTYHRYVRGWRDIGYNFVLDRYGRLFEARAGGIDEPVLGAHAGGYNAASTGIAVLGGFASEPISAAALQSLKRLVAWKLSLHGKPVRGSSVVRVSASGAIYSRFPAGAAVRLPRVAGHRDADATSCPGDALYGRLPELRREAHALAGAVVRATLIATQPQLIAPGPLNLTGTLTRLDGRPCAAATVAVQARRQPADPPGARELTLAEVVTAADGSWSVSLPASYHASLRALHVGAADVPAAVSAPVDVSVAPAVTLTASAMQAAVGQTVSLGGTVAPGKTRVGLELWQQHPAGGRGSRRHLPVVVQGATFSASFTPSAPGTYECAAHTAPDPRNASGRSPVLTLLVTPAPAPAAAPAPAPPPAH